MESKKSLIWQIPAQQEYQRLTGNTHMSNLYECINIYYSTPSGDKPENIGTPGIRTPFFANSNLNK